jgi:hypothetical protein
MKTARVPGANPEIPDPSLPRRPEIIVGEASFQVAAVRINVEHESTIRAG